MSSWGWFILVIILIVPIAYFSYILYRRFQAKNQGLPPPPFNPFAHHDRGGSQIYPAPSGLVGWVKNKYHAIRGSSSRSGAYEQPLGVGGRRGLDPDEAWDARVGAEADGYGPGGYYEEQELGLQPSGGGIGRNDYAGGGYGHDGSLPSYGNEDMQRGRNLSRDDTAYIGGGQKGLDMRYDEEMHGQGERDNPFGDGAEASSLRGVSPRPHEERGHKQQGSGGSLKADDSPTERKNCPSEDAILTARMLITSRAYQQSQAASRVEKERRSFGSGCTVGWLEVPQTVRRSQRMLLVHQAGSVRIGEVVRYTLTYTPSQDRILPPPSQLHVKIKNTSAIPLRAAYLRGPYTLYAACYPSTFDPHYKHDSPYQDGAPEFEPNLKAGGSWMSRLTIPEKTRNSAGQVHLTRNIDGSAPSITWIIEISSQVIFSTSAAVYFELLVSRDEKTLETGFGNLNGQIISTPGQLEDHQQSKRSKDGLHSAAQPKGVFSCAVKLVVDDTTSLWNTPAFPEWSDEGRDRSGKLAISGFGKDGAVAGKGEVKEAEDEDESKGETQTRKRKKVHLVVLTHGLHSNLGADMLYLKESIDATAKKAREDARNRKTQARGQAETQEADAKELPDQTQSSVAPLSGEQDTLGSSADADTEADDDKEEEEVIVRGFQGNACRTERGIQYLGKRLAKYILSLTYPDPSVLPGKKSVKKKISRVFSGDGRSESKPGTPQHSHSNIYKAVPKPGNLAYHITSISFVAHSLGGLTQTYAIAYIHKHSPRFFEEIKPINFVAIGAPFLGLSNENPLYVRFALDFGLVGRTGQDLGLTWKSSTALRGGWDAMIAGIGTDGQRAHKQPDPGSKPLLRILPTGHTHQVLKLFRNRTVYSNVVNDGIVPLRTSCLLFLDWSGLGRVEKARRENGLVTLAGWGWAELTGTNSTANKHLRPEPDSDTWSQSNISGDETCSRSQSQNRRLSLRSKVPQPEEDAVRDDNTAEAEENPKPHQFLGSQRERLQDEDDDANKTTDSSSQQPTNPISGLLSFLRPSQPKDRRPSPKQTKIYKRSQTVWKGSEDADSQSSEGASSVGHPSPRPGNVRGDSMMEEEPNNVFAPPKTTIFESAGDILNPPLPSREFLIDPRSRPRTIFHDRVYHPEDIPPPPAKKPLRQTRSVSTELTNGPSRSPTIYGDQPSAQPDLGGMRVEEKIARAYHHDLSWRKVLVRLEPDAHNNIIVRRMFSNAYGWPVIKHLVDTHFADTFAATTADKYEPRIKRAKSVEQTVGEDGAEISKTASGDIRRTDSESREASDRVPEMKSSSGDSTKNSLNRPLALREDSATWDDLLFEGTDDEDEMDGPVAARHGSQSSPPDSIRMNSKSSSSKGTSDAEIAEFLSRSPPVLSTKGAAPSANTAVSPKSTTSLGLGKSIEEQLSRAKTTDMHTTEDTSAADMATLSAENGH